MTLYGMQKCEAFKYFPFAAALVSEAILGSCSLRGTSLVLSVVGCQAITMVASGLLFQLLSGTLFSDSRRVSPSPSQPGPPSLQSIHISIPPDISLESLSNIIPGTSVDAPTPHTILHLYKLIAQAADLAGATSELCVELGPMFFAKCLQAALGILRYVPECFFAMGAFCGVFLLRCSPHAALTAAFPDLLDAGMQWYLRRNSMNWQTAIFITFHWIFHWLWVHKSQKIRLLAQALTNEKWRRNHRVSVVLDWIMQ
ncbi:hypothetical protein JB92DRAFT_3095444 [Gautieria morchelliformis]|nr:hypothetical protein JB92DRAFT_3095444 [Gautieria morchelliformis]